MPGGMKLFNKMRPRDINLELEIGKKNEIIDLMGEKKYNVYLKHISTVFLKDNLSRDYIKSFSYLNT